MRAATAVVISSVVFLIPAVALAQVAATPSPPPPATAAAPAATAPPVPAATDANGVNLDEVVCKQAPPKTGSRIGGGRECHTVREWNQRQLDSQNSLLRQQRLGYQSGRGG